MDHDAALLAAAERTLEWAAATGAAALSEIGRGPGRDGWLDDIVVTGADFACRVRRARADSPPISSDRAARASVARPPPCSIRLGNGSTHSHAAIHASADVYFALTYDGRTVCTLRRGGRRGARASTATSAATRASAPRSATAGLRAVDTFVARGYRVASRTSDWRIGGCGGVPARAARGLARAALEIAPERRARSKLRHYVAHVDAGSSTLVVGHLDVIESARQHRALDDSVQLARLRRARHRSRVSRNRKHVAHREYAMRDAGTRRSGRAGSVSPGRPLPSRAARSRSGADRATGLTSSTPSRRRLRRTPRDRRARAPREAPRDRAGLRAPAARRHPPHHAMRCTASSP